MRRLVVGLTLAMLACDVGNAWDLKGAPKSVPDEQYRTGTEVGTDYWVWRCYEGHRVVITQYSSAMCGAKAPQLATYECGAKIPDERPDGGYPMRKEPMPDGMRWPGSPPAPRAAADAGDAAP